MGERRGEFDLIDWIRHRAAAHPLVPVGIGDDTAVLRIPTGAEMLVTVDVLVEGVHFTFPPATPALAGRKALAVNLSDIAAMGGRPVAAFVGLVLPRGAGFELGQELQAGLQELADEFGVAVAGGDTNSSDGPLVISVTVVGETGGKPPIRRNGAQVGDAILVTGDLGGSISGKHLTFTPRVREVWAIRERATLHAMLDISDGLAADLHHILEESGVGAVLNAGQIPISAAAQAMNDGRSPLEHALSDGEDFELLFTTSAADAARLLADPPDSIRITQIGEIVAGSGCHLRDEFGQLTPLGPAGWRHSL